MGCQCRPRADLGSGSCIRGRVVRHEDMRTRSPVRARRTALTSDCQTASGQESRDDSVPWILFLSVTLDGAVKRREHSSPDTKVSSQHWRSGFDSRYRTDHSFSLQVGSVLTIPGTSQYAMSSDFGSRRYWSCWENSYPPWDYSWRL